jgi:hypothetical protein
MPAGMSTAARWEIPNRRLACARALLAVLIVLLPGFTRIAQALQQSERSTAGGFPYQLLQHPEVQKELKLESEQLQKIEQIRRAVHEKHQEEQGRLRNLGLEERRWKAAALASKVSEEIMQAVDRVLQPGQSKRLEQIHLQQQGLRAFSDPRVDKVLRLTDKQKVQVKKIGEDAVKEARMLFRTTAQSGFPETLKKIETVRRKAIEQAVGLLTDEQRKGWKQLIGEPFEVKSTPPLIRQPDPT